MGIIDSQEQYDERAERLYRSLVFAAALCASFELGEVAGYRAAGRVFDERRPRNAYPVGWYPGCRKEAQP